MRWLTSWSPSRARTLETDESERDECHEVEHSAHGVSPHHGAFGPATTTSRKRCQCVGARPNGAGWASSQLRLPVHSDLARGHLFGDCVAFGSGLLADLRVPVGLRTERVLTCRRARSPARHLCHPGKQRPDCMRGAGITTIGGLPVRFAAPRHFARGLQPRGVHEAEVILRNVFWRSSSAAERVPNPLPGDSSMRTPFPLAYIWRPMREAPHRQRPADRRRATQRVCPQIVATLEVRGKRIGDLVCHHAMWRHG